MSRRADARVFAAGVALIAALTTGSALQPTRSLSVAAVSEMPLAAWDARVAAMLQDGRLAAGPATADTQIEGRVHERLLQQHAGLPVFGGVLLRQTDGLGVRSIFGRLYEDIGEDPTPHVDADAAAAAAASAGGDQSVADGEPVLGFLPAAGAYVLAWQVPVRSPRDIRRVYVDAVRGTVVRSESRIRRQIGPVGRGTGVFGDEKKLSTSRSFGRFEARDTARPGAVETYDLRGSGAALDRLLFTGELAAADVAQDVDNDWRDGAVVDAHVYQGWVYDFFFKRFGRQGLDGRNGRTAAVVHPLARAEADAAGEDERDLFVNNALYLGRGRMVLGDGDGRSYGWFAGALDVVAHEWAHGVTEYTSDLDYVDEPGALNESFSDIMGVAAEFFHEQPGVGRQRADWLIGEDVVLGGRGYIRSLANPAAAGHPDHYSLVRHIGTGIDNGGIHVNAGVPNHAFYLAVAGGHHRISGVTVTGVGLASIDRIERVFYRAFTHFLAPGAQFHDARAATIQAARELFGAGSIEHQQVELAWSAVGVR